MNHSVSGTIIITGTAEHEVERNLYLIVKGLISLGFNRQLNAYQENRVKRKTDSSIGSSIHTTSVIELRTLCKISSDKGSSNSILGEGSGCLLVRRSIGADLIKRRILLFMAVERNDTITIPRSDLCHTLGILRRHLPGRNELQPYCIDTHLIEQTLQVRILRSLTQHRDKAEDVRTSCLIL